MADIGKAYVQIVPSAQGISGSISNVLGGEATSAGASAGSTIASKIKGAIGAAAIGMALKESILQGAALEQSIGGIETLFKEHADTVIKNASKAYRTAGISANAYMEQATSFSASLLQSLGGDTKKAAEYADMAITDMSDNANKMGTDIARIQDAYQGFAKQNYTMLDNLKLGYGGTKTEMERLLADAEKITGIKYDINNLSDVYSAIHVIQEELGVTGTTALEASQTLTGSFNAMKAAAQDFMGNLVLGRNVGQSMAALAETAATFLFDNLMPALGNVLMGLPVAIGALLQTGLPKFLSSGAEMIEALGNGIIKGLPGFLKTVRTAVPKAIETITKNLPKVLSTGVEFITKFVTGILQRLPEVIKTAGSVITSFIEGGKGNFPVLMEHGGELLGNLIRGIIANLPAIISAIAQVMGSLLKAIASYLPAMAKGGIELITGLASGLAGSVLEKIKTAMGKVKSAILTPIENARDSIKSAVDKIKSFFNVTLTFKGIKLPHISMSWNKSGVIAKAAKLLGIPGVPKFSVNWYKTGGIFDDPSIIGVGEAGAEAVVPLDALWSKLDRFVSNALSQPNGVGAQILTGEQIKEIVVESATKITEGLIDAMSNVTVEHTTNLNGKAVAKGLAPLIDNRLGRQAVLEGRGV